MLKNKIILAAAASLIALIAIGHAKNAQAATYNAALDFSIVNGNPNGTWQYGYTSSLGSTLNLFNTTSTQSIGGSSLAFWQSTVVQQSLVPAAFKNNGPNTTLGLAPGSIALHGGPGNEYAVLRFTAPTTSVYTINSQFLAGDTGDTDANVLLQGNGASPLFTAATTNTNPVFNTSLSLTAGQTVDFVVGTKGDYGADTTPVNVIISSAVVPEAGSAALLGAAALPLVGLVLRRRKN